MTTAKRRIPDGRLEAGTSRRDRAVLSDGGSLSESVVYDFSVDGGAVGDVSFGRNLPEGALVTKVISDELTTLTSGGSATITLKAGSTALTGAVAFDTGFTGQDNQALASSADAIKIASSSELKITIATAALTAGKVRFFVQYLLPND